MALREFTAAEPAQSIRRIAFDSAEIVDLGGHAVLVVRGQAPCINMDVRLSPLIYVDCPEYWEIEVIGVLPGAICLNATKPYVAAIPLRGSIGSKGIEVLGSGGSKRIELSGGCERGAATS